jgi:hypothetical protein
MNLDSLAKAPDQLPALMSTLLSQTKTSQTPLVFVPLLGVAVDVTVRLKNSQSEPSTRLSPEHKVDSLVFFLEGEMCSRWSLYTTAERYIAPVCKLDPHVQGASRFSHIRKTTRDLVNSTIHRPLDGIT